MRTASIFAFASIVSAASLVACSGTTTGTGTGSSSGNTGTNDATEAFDAEGFCTKIVDQCGQSITKAECIANFELIRVSADCNAAMVNATCAHLGSPTSDPVKVCFPPCSGGPSCNGTETITTCTNDGISLTIECARVCEKAGAKYSGICGTSARGTSSADGKAKCWCE